jgi:hypothetical protein
LLLAMSLCHSVAEVLTADRVVDWVPNSTIGVQASNTNAWTAWCCDGPNVPGTDEKLDYTGVTNSGLALQYAIQNAPANSIVWLTNGFLRVSNTAGLSDLGNRSNIRIKGQGMRGTTIFLEGSREFLWNHSKVTLLTNALLYSGSDPVLAKGASNLTLAASMAGLFVGKTLYLSQASDNPPGSGVNTNFVLVDQVGIEGSSSAADGMYGSRANGQLITVTAISGNNITFWPPSHWNFTNSYSPTVYSWHATAPVYSNWGIEDISILRTNRTSTSYGFQFYRNKNFWLRNVEMSYGYNSFIAMNHNLFGEIAYCYFHDTTYPTPGGGYGIDAAGANTGIWAHDNVFAGTRVPIIVSGGSGNAWTYNMTALPINSSGAVVKNPSIHGDYVKYNLFEGNVGWRMGADFVHGSTGFNTFARNWGQATDGSAASYNWAVTLNIKSYFYNYVGNVLGHPGMSGVYEAIAPGSRSAGTKTVWDIGYSTDGYTDYLAPSGKQFYHDTNVVWTLVRHGNADYMTGTVTYDPNIADHTIPPSYLTGFTEHITNWGNCPVPTFGPDVVGWTNRPPALMRYQDYILAGDFTFEPAAAPEPEPPSVPTGLSATAQRRSIVVQWEAVDGATGYGVQRSTDNATWSTIPNEGALFLNDFSVTVGTAYYYRVRAESTAGNSSYSSSVNATVVAGPKSAVGGRVKVGGRARL